MVRIFDVTIEHAVRVGQRPAGESGAGSARHEGDAVLGAGRDQCGELGGVLRDHDQAGVTR